MTTNKERAIGIIEGEHDPHFGPIDAPSLVYALSNADLLMPDLPELDEGEWEEGRSVISVDDEGFVLPSIDSRPTHPGRARRIAYALLAAADYAEQGQENG